MSAVAIRVPASTSNLGAGFDCLGIAVDRWLRVVAERSGETEGGPITVEHHGTLDGLDLPAERDLLVRGFMAACRAAGRSVPQGVRVVADSDIPVGRGLGSSAAAVVGGAAAANALLDLGLAGDDLVAIGMGIEGHCDNVVPAVRGGAALVVPGLGGAPPTIASLAVHESLALVFAVPDFAVETARARAVLPLAVPHAVAAAGVARAAALVAGLARADGALLAAGLDDVLHVPYRRRFVPAYDAVTAAARAGGAYGATLSGSGSSVVAVAPAAAAPAVAGAMTAVWRAGGTQVETFAIRHPAAGLSVTRPAATVADLTTSRRS